MDSLEAVVQKWRDNLTIIRIKSGMKSCICILAIILSLFLVVPTHAAISVLGGDSFGGPNGSTITLNTTMPPGANGMMVAVFHLELGATVTTPDPTWNTTESFTQANSIDTSGADNTEIWILENPTVGTFDFFATLSTSNTHMVGLFFLSGVKIGDSLGATPAGVFGTGTTDSITFTIADGSIILDGATWGSKNITLTPTAPQNKEYEVAGTVGGPAHSMMTGSGSTRIEATGDEFTNTYTSTDSFNYSYLAIEIKELPMTEVHQDLVTNGVHQDHIANGVHQSVVNGT